MLHTDHLTLSLDINVLHLMELRHVLARAIDLNHFEFGHLAISPFLNESSCNPARNVVVPPSEFD